ncbi:MAG: DUF469 family protein [Desulfobacterales bacterium]|nr:DUF469 family protein [Desulfobacterales bacterium]MCP4161356.1 DUF469 family protein [Deltaproteobacteria bacterium]
MKKRLRKKLYLGEFKELGFEIAIELEKGMDEEQLDNFISIFAEEALDKNGLDIEGGGNTSDIFGMIILNKRGSVSEEQRLFVEAWLKDRKEVTKTTVGQLVDAWYS